MENILHDFNKKIISLVENYLKKFIFSKGISSFTDDLVAEFAHFGSDLTQFMIEYAEQIIFELDERKEKFESLEKDNRNIVSIFGEIQYKRRYYEDKENHNKVYLLDKLIGIEPKQRLLENVREKLIENAIESSYESKIVAWVVVKDLLEQNSIPSNSSTTLTKLLVLILIFIAPPFFNYSICLYCSQLQMNSLR